MSESEERPTKIRKLDREISPNLSEKSVTFSGTNGGVARESHNDESEEDDASMKSEVEGPLPPQNAASNTESGKLQPMSKSQLKKIRKRQEWEAGKDYRKAKRKEKLKKKKALRAEQEAEDKTTIGTVAPKSVPPKQSYRRPTLVPVTFVLDCDFDELMSEKEIISLASQLSRCYSDNRSAPYKGHLVISSFRGQLRDRFETALSNHHHGWKGVKFMDGDFVQAGEEADIVMRGTEGGRVFGALASSQGMEEIAHPTTQNNEGSEVGSEKQGVDPVGVPALAKATFPTGETEYEEAKKDQTTSPIDVQAPLAANNSANLEAGEACSPINLDEELTIGEHTTTITDPTLPRSYQPPNSTSQPSIVYLSSDSPNTLDVLSPYTTYIVGGIVDKNRHKGICYKRARERGIPTARLPIGEYMTMQSRTVLATNHVIEIMVRWLEDGDWGKAFLRVIPKRKEAKLKIKEPGQANRESEEVLGQQDGVRDDDGNEVDHGDGGGRRGSKS